MVSNLVLIYFGRPLLADTIKTNWITLQTVDSEICCFDFLRYISCHILLTGQVSLSSYLHLKCRPVYVLQLFISPVCDVINSEINLVSHQAAFLTLTKKSGQRFKYVKNKKNVLTWNKKHFSSTLKAFYWSR